MRCAACGVELAPGMLACPACRRLVHGGRLKGLAAAATTAEGEGRLTDAVASLREARELLPAGSKQREVIDASIRRLVDAIDRAGIAPPPKDGRAKGVAGLSAVGLVLWKLKFVILAVLGKVKLLAFGLASIPTLLSMLAWVSLDRSRGVAFALGLLLSIYVHEMGHVSALQRYGLKATAPMFVPGFGAFVRLRQIPVDAREDARIGLAGPIWGAAAAIVALGIGLALHQRTILTVASVGAMINVFNLIPVWQLDGGRGFRALDVKQRLIVAALAAVTGLLLQQPMGFAVAALGAVRAKSDLPPRGDARAFHTFAALLVILAVVARVAGPTV